MIRVQYCIVNCSNTTTPNKPFSFSDKLSKISYSRQFTDTLKVSGASLDPDSGSEGGEVLPVDTGGEVSVLGPLHEDHSEGQLHVTGGFSNDFQFIWFET